MDQDDVPPLDAAIEVIIFVDHCVELTLATNRHQAQRVPVANRSRQVVNVQPGASIGRGKTRLVEGPATDLELLFRAVDVGHSFKAGPGTLFAGPALS